MKRHITGRYELDARLGSGAMGDVYRAIDASTGETVAIKALKPDVIAHSPKLIERFRREGEALRALDHPNIASLIDVIRENGDHYLVMEYVPGGDLSQRIAAHPNGMPIHDALTIGLDLADALTRAHRLDVIHRDLKPANVLIAEDGTPRLTDFGFAHFEHLDSLTGSGDVVGTLHYLSPEALLGEAVDKRADIWSFGIVLYEMIMGQRPFMGTSPGEVMAAMLNAPLPDFATARSDIPDALADLIYRMLEKPPESRIPSVRHVGVALEDVQRGRSSSRSESRFPAPAGDNGTGAHHNLPAQVTGFVGRETEVNQLEGLFGDQSNRLITILGPGGMGKTRLALEIAAHEVDRFGDGAFFVDLAKLRDPDTIPTAIADATGYRFTNEGTLREQILRYLSNKHMLLTLDNFEHILEGRDLVTDILTTASDVTVLATSRMRLNLLEETVFTLQSLEFANWDTSDDALQYAAGQLFLQSARRTQVDFTLQVSDLANLARICQLVEGVPLGILLAAAWVDTLSLAEIAEEIAQSIDFLELEAANLPDRQRSMRAAMDYSWNLLNEEERVAFARMSVFRGGCSRRAAQAVSGTSIRMLTALVNKSYLQRDQETGRFHIHELLRQYGEEHLRATGEFDAMRDAHMNYYLPALAEREAALKGDDQLGALDDIDVDFENIRAAWLWSVETDTPEALRGAIMPMALYCTMHSRLIDGADLFNTALTTLEDRSDEEAAVLRGWLTLARDMLDPLGRQLGDQREAFDAIYATARRADDRSLEAYATYALGWVHVSQHEFTDAKRRFEESLMLYEKLGDRFYQGFSLHYIAFCMFHSGALADVQIINQRAAELRREIGDYFGLGMSLTNLGAAAIYMGDKQAGVDYSLEAIEVARHIGNVMTIAFVQSNLAETYMELNRVTEAREVVQAAQENARRINNSRIEAAVIGPLSDIALYEEDYDELERLTQQRESFHLADIQQVFIIAKNLTLIALGKGDFDVAAEHLQDAIPISYFPPSHADTLHLYAFLLAHWRAHERAAELVSLFHHTPGHLSIEDENRPLCQRLVDDLKTALGEDRFAEAWARGATLDLEATFEKEFGVAPRNNAG